MLQSHQETTQNRIQHCRPERGILNLEPTGQKAAVISLDHNTAWGLRNF
jgi:hypothetical protein